MPCSDGGYSDRRIDVSNREDKERIKELEDKVDKLTAMLCGLSYDYLKNSLSNFEDFKSRHEDFKVWHDYHSEIDLKRIDSIINSLSEVEKDMLYERLENQ